MAAIFKITMTYNLNLIKWKIDPPLMVQYLWNRKLLMKITWGIDFDGTTNLILIELGLQKHSHSWEQEIKIISSTFWNRCSLMCYWYQKEGTEKLYISGFINKVWHLSNFDYAKNCFREKPFLIVGHTFCYKNTCTHAHCVMNKG